MRVDVHTHVVVDLPNFAEQLRDHRWPQLVRHGRSAELIRDGRAVRALTSTAWDVGDRLIDMDEAGVDVQVLSPIPPMIVDWAEAGPGRDWAFQVNAGVAAMVAQEPDRFVGIGTIPINQPEEALAVLGQAAELGLKGVEIGCSASGLELDAPELRAVFAAAEQHGLVVFVHPLILGATADWTDRIVGPEVTFGLGMPTDTAIAATRLAFGGVTADHPDLRVLLAHGGGSFFWTLPRIAHLWDRDPSRPSALELTANLYADSVVYDPGLLGCLCERVGTSRIAFGTDYPLPAQDDVAGGVLRRLKDADAIQVAGGTAVELFGLA